MFGKTIYDEYFAKEKKGYEVSSEYEMTESRNENVSEPFKVFEKKTPQFITNKGETEKNLIEKTMDNIVDLVTPDSTSKEELDPNVTVTNNDIKNAKENNDNKGNNKNSGLKCPTDKYANIVAKEPKYDVDRIHYINVGGGDSTLIESNGHFGLVDSTNPTYQDGSPQAIISPRFETVEHVIDYLKTIMKCSGASCKGKLDFVIGTHAHSDHIGGMNRIAEVFGDSNTTYYYRAYEATSDDFFENGIYNSTIPGEYDKANDWDNDGYYDRTIEAMTKNNVCLEEVTNKDLEFPFGDFKIKFLNTQPVSLDESICIRDNVQISDIGKMTKSECEAKGGKLYARGENKNAFVQLITYQGKIKVLLSADMEKEDERRLINNPETKALISNVSAFKMGHHGTKTSNILDFVKVLKPKYAIISRARMYGPSMAFLETKYMIENFGTKAIMTGSFPHAIVQTFDNNSYTFNDGSSALLNLDDVATKGKFHKVDLLGIPAWFCYENKTTPCQSGLRTIDGKTYNIDTNGYISTGWQYLSRGNAKHWYYFNGDGVMQTGWQYIKEKWYYLNSSGQMLTGWQQINYKGTTSWFYFDENGAMLTGWQKLKWENSINWYYFDDKGIMLTGWQKLKWNGVENWYYFNTVTSNNHIKGAMVTGWQKLMWNGVENWYYFNNSGAMVTGFVYDNGKTYYLKSDGTMVHDTCLTINGVNCCFNSSGAKTN